MESLIRESSSELQLWSDKLCTCTYAIMLTIAISTYKYREYIAKYVYSKFVK